MEKKNPEQRKERLFKTHKNRLQFLFNVIIWSYITGIFYLIVELQRGGVSLRDLLLASLSAWMQLHILLVGILCATFITVIKIHHENR